MDLTCSVVKAGQDFNFTDLVLHLCIVGICYVRSVCMRCDARCDVEPR